MHISKGNFIATSAIRVLVGTEGGICNQHCQNLHLFFFDRAMDGILYLQLKGFFMKENNFLN